MCCDLVIKSVEFLQHDISNSEIYLYLYQYFRGKNKTPLDLELCCFAVVKYFLQILRNGCKKSNKNGAKEFHLDKNHAVSRFLKFF